MNADSTSQVLFERWSGIAAAGGDALALVDLSTSKRWTFRELRRESLSGGSNSGPIAFPSGHNATFVLEVLRAWRQGQATCPLEPGQAAPGIPPVPSYFAHLKLTSASTGLAKCVAFRAGQIAADPANIVATMGLRSDWPNVASISLSHSYGFSNFVLPLVLHGIPLIIAESPLPEVLARAAALAPSITVAAVPALWRTWAANRAIPPNVKLAVSAGAPLPIELENEIYTETGLKVHNFYGSSECGGIAYDRSTIPRKDPAYAGTPLENVSLSTSANGSLIVESSAVAETYWPHSQPALRAPRFETTDLAELKDNGVFLRGRASDLINVAGRKTSPEAIEAALRSHPAVIDCVVFGTNDQSSDRFDTIVACVNSRQTTSITELAQFLSHRLPNWQIPRQWWFTSELVPNGRGKFSRSEWRQRFLQRKKDNTHQFSPER